MSQAAGDCRPTSLRLLLGFLVVSFQSSLFQLSQRSAVISGTTPLLLAQDHPLHSSTCQSTCKLRTLSTKPSSAALSAPNTAPANCTCQSCCACPHLTSEQERAAARFHLQSAICHLPCHHHHTFQPRPPHAHSQIAIFALIEINPGVHFRRLNPELI